MSNDDRFNSMHNKPTFKSSKKDSFKVKVDDRFKTLLSDERFQSVPGQVDKYGRKSKSKDGANKVAKEMREFYDIDEGEEAVEDPAKNSKPAAKPTHTGVDRLEYLNKLARGEISDDDSSSTSGSSESSESDSDSQSGEDGESSDDDSTTRKNKASSYGDASHKSALQIPNQEEPEMASDVVSTRIAIQNSDWENVSAEDLMVVLQSFCPSGSVSAVRKVTVYVSDFGKKRMELESRYGPQGIWKIQEEDEEDDENDEDLYDHIAGVDDEEEEQEQEEEEEGSDADSSNEGSASGSEEGSESEEEPVKAQKKGTAAAPLSRKAAKAVKKGDFVRRNGAVGIVLHDDLKRRGVSSKYKSGDSDEEEEEQSGSDDGSDEGSDEGSGSDEDGANGAFQKRSAPKKANKKIKDGEGFDEVALRKYELSKLRYYFAVAECDSARTANMIYEELDGVEMESSAMVFDLSLVPEELSFEDREVRDSFSASASGAVNPNYKPPDFVVNALQHTKVQCSWDEGEKLRDRQLSNFSTWRNLNESELQQYVADSDSDDDDEEDSDDGQGETKSSKSAKGKASKKKQNKAALMRKMLLGDAEDGSEEEDDFFAADDAAAASGSDGEEKDSMYGDDEVPEGFGSDDDDEEEDEEDGKGRSMTYMPDLGKDILAKKRGAEETPYEAEQRKMAEKKKARKVAKKAYQEAQEAEKKASALGGKKGKGKAAAPAVLTEEERKKQAALELLFDDEQKHDYDMREVVKAEKDKSRGKKSNKRKKAKQGDDAVMGDDDFKIDMADDRFSKLFEGDSRFGIDKTSTEFRPTPAVKDILSEQSKRRALKEKNETSAPSSGRSNSTSKSEEPAGVDVNNLVNKLKRKYAKA